MSPGAETRVGVDRILPKERRGERRRENRCCRPITEKEQEGKMHEEQERGKNKILKTLRKIVWGMQ